MTITHDEVVRALDDAVALSREFDGLDIRVKLRALGLDADGLADLLVDRWRQHRPGFDPSRPYELLAQGWLEGLLTGLQLRGRDDEPAER